MERSRKVGSASIKGARKKALGPEHPDTLLSMANLAATYWALNRWNEAENLEVQVRELGVKGAVLGEFSDQHETE